MGVAVVSSCDSAKILEASEHALDGVAVAVQVGREAVLPASVGLRWNVRSGPLALDLAADGVAVVALVAVQDHGCGHLVEQGVGGGAIRHLAASQQKGKRAAEAIAQRVDFRGSPPARAADRLGEFPPLPPAAQRCALTAEESIKICSGGPPAEAKAWKISSQTPFAAQRTKRL